MKLTLTVIVSAVTSGLISILTFIIGVRMAKDQGDRAAVRQIYQRLFEHFRGIDAAIGDGKPKSWADFPLKGNQYTPPCKQMHSDGEANLLPPALMAQCETLETDALTAGGRYRHWVRETYIPALKALVAERTGGKGGSITGKAYRELSAFELGLMSGEDVLGLSTELEAENLGVGLQVAVERGRHEMLYLYPEHLDGANVGTLLEAARALASADPQGQALSDGLRALRPRLAVLLGRLKARIRDPHPLHESILRAFRDVFRRG
ncbi:hypothetical protein M9978_19310 [Sphingomonas sp. MG17]|uniref:Uncharacterized protein n=2 Tax=Sphingomonas tagetis TaxID=2949092 RepID=A0A9X2HQG7_9SPHN|nr:hypothetical protein [Sphingomonas tagetis]